MGYFMSKKARDTTGPDFAIPHNTGPEFRKICSGASFMPPSVVVKAYNAEVVKSKDDPERTIVFTISTNDVDRDNDTVSVSGWDLKNFNNAGSVLWAHNPELPPVAKPIKTWVSNSKGSKTLKSRAQ